MLRITAHLTHEVGYNPVEDGVLQTKAPASRAEHPEVLRRLRDSVGIQFHADGAEDLAISGDGQENPGVGVSGLFLGSGQRLHRGVFTGLTQLLLTVHKGLLEFVSQVGVLELGCQLLHTGIALWRRKRS